MKSSVLVEYRRVILNCFVGIAIPHQPTLASGVYGPIRSEKILKFNRKALRKIGKATMEKVDPRYGGGEDTMVVKVGKPGSRERVEALRSQYENTNEISPFSWSE